MVSKREVKELKQPDKLQTTFVEFIQLVSANRQKVILAGSILMAVLLLTGGYFLYRFNYEQKASQIFIKAFNQKMTALQSRDANIDHTEVYREVIKKYPDSRAAKLSTFQLGNYYYEKGEIDEAIKYYTSYLARSSAENEMRTLAYNSLGYCFEAKKEYQKALDQFQKAISTREGKIFAAITFENIARIYEELNQNAKALEYYSKALAETTDPSLQMLLKRKIAALS